MEVGAGDGDVKTSVKEEASRRGEEFTGEFTTWKRNIILGLVRSLTQRHIYMSPGFTSTNNSTGVQV